MCIFMFMLMIMCGFVFECRLPIVYVCVCVWFYGNKLFLGSYVKVSVYGMCVCVRVFTYALYVYVCSYIRRCTAYPAPRRVRWEDRRGGGGLVRITVYVCLFVCLA